MNTTAKAPRGVSGKQRELFLSLTDTQREAYMTAWNRGRLAAHCYKIATGEYPA